MTFFGNVTLVWHRTLVNFISQIILFLLLVSVYSLHKNVKQKLGVFWASHMLWMKLYTNVWQLFMHNALIKLVIFIVEQWIPFFERRFVRQWRVIVDRIAMILTCNKTTLGARSNLLSSHGMTRSDPFNHIKKIVLKYMKVNKKTS